MIHYVVCYNVVREVAFMGDYDYKPFSIWHLVLSPTVLILATISIGGAIKLYLAYH